MIILRVLVKSVFILRLTNHQIPKSLKQKLLFIIKQNMCNSPWGQQRLKEMSTPQDRWGKGHIVKLLQLCMYYVCLCILLKLMQYYWIVYLIQYSISLSLQNLIYLCSERHSLYLGGHWTPLLSEKLLTTLVSITQVTVNTDIVLCPETT